jgi:hypothetical protein
LAVVALGGFVLLGWLLDIAVLKSVIPGLQTMKANAAAGFTFLGLGLSLCSVGGGRQARRAALACVV